MKPLLETNFCHPSRSLHAEDFGRLLLRGHIVSTVRHLAGLAKWDWVTNFYVKLEPLSSPGARVACITGVGFAEEVVVGGMVRMGDLVFCWPESKDQDPANPDSSHEFPSLYVIRPTANGKFEVCGQLYVG